LIHVNTPAAIIFDLASVPLISSRAGAELATGRSIFNEKN
jgi:hypothetical protein